MFKRAVCLFTVPFTEIYHKIYKLNQIYPQILFHSTVNIKVDYASNKNPPNYVLWLF